MLRTAVLGAAVIALVGGDLVTCISTALGAALGIRLWTIAHPEVAAASSAGASAPPKNRRHALVFGALAALAVPLALVGVLSLGNAIGAGVLLLALAARPWLVT